MKGISKLAAATLGLIAGLVLAAVYFVFWIPAKLLHMIWRMTK